MKKFIFFLVALSIINGLQARGISLSQLLILSKKQNWEDVNDFLSSKNWEFYSSKRGDNEHYNQITWTFNKSSWDDKAESWFHLYTYDGYPNKILYQVANKVDYTSIFNALSSSGFKKTESEIFDDILTTTYGNKTHYVKVNTGKTEGYYSESSTFYTFEVINKSSVYDPENGEKVLYFDNSNVVAYRCTLKDGDLEGPVYIYNIRGKVIGKSIYKGGIKNGQEIVYDDYENIIETSNYTNGKRNGVQTKYVNGSVDSETNFVNDLREGPFKSYYYSDGVVIGYLEGNYSIDRKTGVWKVIRTSNLNQEIIEYTTYSFDVPHGTFQELLGDTLIIGNKNNGDLDGEILIYTGTKFKQGYSDLNRIYVDTARLELVGIANFKMGKRNGKSTVYEDGQIIVSGNYIEGKRIGEWNYYYAPKIEGTLNPYVGEIYLTERYKNDMLQGTTELKSNLVVAYVDCANKTNIVGYSNCKKVIKTGYSVIANYDENHFHGYYKETDSSGLVIKEGNFASDDRNGFWVLRYNTPPGYITEKGNYKYGLRFGEWNTYIDEDRLYEKKNYLNDKLDGEWEVFMANGSRKYSMHFENNLLISAEIFDEMGNVISSYQIIKTEHKSFGVQLTNYLQGKTEIVEYTFQGELLEYYEVGFDKKMREAVDNGAAIKSGVYKEFDKDKILRVEGKYLNNLKTGAWGFHYPEQKITMVVDYKAGVKVGETYFVYGTNSYYSGTFEFVDQATGVLESRKIKDGLRNGKTIYRNKTGEVIKKEKYVGGIIVK